MPSIREPSYDEIVLRSPPALPDSRGAGTLLTALPALGGLGSVAYMFTGPRHPATYIAGGMFLLSSIAMIVGLLIRSRGDKRRSIAGARRRFEAHLIERRSAVRAAARLQRRRAHERLPPPRSLWIAARSAKGSTPDDADFGLVRIGTSTQPLAPPLRVDATDADADIDAASARLLERFVGVHSQLTRMPRPLRLTRHTRLRITGEDGLARGCAYALVAHACTFHSPRELAIFICGGKVAEWEWAKWLPHARGRAGLPVAQLGEAIRLHTGHSVVVLDDGPGRLFEPVAGRTTLLTLGGPPGTGPPRIIDESAPGHPRDLAPLDEGADSAIDELDSISAAEAECVARILARRYAGGAPHGEQATDTALERLLGIADPDAIDMTSLRRASTQPERRLCLPMGWNADGTALFLDIKEAALGGAGPHGLVVGATGSGKSELLRTMVLGAALTHPPTLLNLVLVDFKGGATFADLSGVPHVSALITNLYDDAVMVERMRDALISELDRRQALLATGHAAS